MSKTAFSIIDSHKTDCLDEEDNQTKQGFEQVINYIGLSERIQAGKQFRETTVEENSSEPTAEDTLHKNIENITGKHGKTTSRPSCAFGRIGTRQDNDEFFNVSRKNGQGYILSAEEDP